MAVDGTSLALLGTALATGGSGFWCCWKAWFRLQHVQNTPTSRIRSAAQGFVELAGHLETGDAGPIQAPLSGSHCLWWRYRIEEYRTSSKQSRWEVVESASSDQPLRLLDETGECLIDPAGAQVHCRHRTRWEGRERHPGRPRERGWLSALTGSGRYRYTEEYLLSGEPLYALGDFLTRGGGRDAQAAEQLRQEVIREWKQDFPALLERFDRDGDGHFSDTEWQRVQLAAGLEVEDRLQAAASQPPTHHLRRPQTGPFVLSAFAESELIRRLRWQAAGGIALCLLGIGLAGLLLERQGLLPF